MAGYSVVNLKEVEDSAEKFGYAPNLETRFARGPLELEESGLSYLRIAPGFRLPWGHVHGEQEEVYLVLSGSARVKVEDEVVELGPWDTLRMAPNMWHGVEAGPEGAEMLLFGAPNTENEDVQMEQGWWSD
jgi:quercetin dioxygenase-like cupin family protein